MVSCCFHNCGGFCNDESDKCKQNAATKIALFLFFVIALSTGYFFMSNNLKVESAGDFFDVGKVYFSWVGSAIKNIAAITSNVIHMNWSSNSTSV